MSVSCWRGRESECSGQALVLTLILHGELLQAVLFTLERLLFVLRRKRSRITGDAGKISPLGWLSVLVERPRHSRAQEQQTRGQNIP